MGDTGEGGIVANVRRHTRTHTKGEEKGEGLRVGRRGCCEEDGFSKVLRLFASEEEGEGGRDRRLWEGGV